MSRNWPRAWMDRAVPDRLTAIVPDWLVETARLQHAPVPWADMARAAFAICVPLIAGILGGDRALGVLVATGGLMAVVVDVGGPVRTRLMRVGSAALGGATGLAIGSLIHGRGWLVSPRAADQRYIAAVFRELSRGFEAIGTARAAQARLAVTQALNVAYDSLLAARSMAGGRDRRLYRLVAELNQAHLISEAMTALALEGTRVPPRVSDALGEYAARIEIHTPPPPVPRLDGTTPGTLLLRDALAGLASMMSRNWKPTDELPPASLHERLRGAIDGPAVLDRLTGRLTWIYTIRLTVSIGVATAVSEALPLQRSYWVVLTAAIVLKPDFGSVFARAVQRGAGTIIGAVLGAAILAVVPHGPWLLAPFGLLAALLPYGRTRNFGLQAVFLTPLVVLLIDLLAPGGWRLAEDRLIDTLIGCALALLVGYAPWPMSWQAHLPEHFAEAIWDVCRYMREALITPAAQDGAAGAARPAGAGVTRLPARSRLQRSAYRALSDMRTEFERTMSEPPPASRRAAAWWPALAELEQVADAVTAKSVDIGRGIPPPRPAAVMQLTAALDEVAKAVQADVVPSGAIGLPADQPLAPVTDAVRAVLGVIASPRRPPAAQPAPL